MLKSLLGIVLESWKICNFVHKASESCSNFDVSNVRNTLEHQWRNCTGFNQLQSRFEVNISIKFTNMGKKIIFSQVSARVAERCPFHSAKLSRKYGSGDKQRWFSRKYIVLNRDSHGENLNYHFFPSIAFLLSRVSFPPLQEGSESHEVFVWRPRPRPRARLVGKGLSPQQYPNKNSNNHEPVGDSGSWNARLIGELKQRRRRRQRGRQKSNRVRLTKQQLCSFIFTFFNISLPSLHDYIMKLLVISSFADDLNTSNHPLFLFLNFKTLF